MKKTRIFSLAAAAALTLSAMPVLSASAEGEEEKVQNAVVKVSIAKEGLIALDLEQVIVDDVDNDGKLTVYDALYHTHGKFYTDANGKAADKVEDVFATTETEHGLFITKLWGVENGGSYGYTVNDQFANSLKDEIKDGDRIYAYAYKDTEKYTDLYTYFDVTEAETRVGEPITLTLKSLSFDEKYNTVEKPVKGVKIICPEAAKEYGVTDENGVAEITPEAKGEFLIAASSSDQIIVPALMHLTVKEDESIKVKFSITNQGEQIYNGTTVGYPLYNYPVTVYDKNGDGKYDIDEALYYAHKELYGKGDNETADPAYATEETQSGKFIKTLWGVTNGGSYSYLVNNRFANGLTDEVKDGDSLFAYVYKDTEKFSDLFTFFTEENYKANENEEFTVTLKSVSFDGQTFEQVEKPVKGATILVDGKESEFVTDENGQATLKLPVPKEPTVPVSASVLSAKLDGQVIVPPMAIVSIKEAEKQEETTGSENGNSQSADQPAPKTGDAGTGMLCVSVLLAAGAAFALRRRHED